MVHYCCAVLVALCMCTCREDILELDGIHKRLLTKLCPWDSTDHSSQFMLSHLHQMQQPLKETTVLRTSGMRPMDEAPPLAPPTLLHNRPSISEDFSQGRSQSLGLQSSPLEHIHHDPSKTIETTLLDKSSPSPSLLPADSLIQSEAISEQSLSPPPAPGELSMHGLVEEDSERQVASPEDAPTPLTGSRSGSLTDVSMCSEDSSVVVQSHDIEMQSISQQQMETDLPGKLDENEQLANNSDSPSESSSICSSPRPTFEAEVADMDKRDTPPASERFPTSTTSNSSTISHQVTTAPLDSVTTTVPLMSHHTRIPHHSSSGQERSPKKLKKDSPTLTSKHPSTSTSDCTHEQAPPFLGPPPPLPTFQLPNFFMTPQQLEESMRSLRAEALSRAPPRTHPHYPPPTTTTTSMQAQCHHHCVSSAATHLKTLQEVRSYLESRRTAATDRRPKAKEISAMETQRLARIFSS